MAQRTPLPGKVRSLETMDTESLMEMLSNRGISADIITKLDVPFGPAPPPTPEPDYLCQCNMAFDTQNQCVCEPGFSMVDGTCQPACQVS